MFSCYVAIGFRSEPLEIWHLKSMRLLRRMSRSCPIIVDMVLFHSLLLTWLNPL